MQSFSSNYLAQKNQGIHQFPNINKKITTFSFLEGDSLSVIEKFVKII